MPTWAWQATRHAQHAQEKTCNARRHDVGELAHARLEEVLHLERLIPVSTKLAANPLETFARALCCATRNTSS